MLEKYNVYFILKKSESSYSLTNPRFIPRDKFDEGINFIDDEALGLLYIMFKEGDLQNIKNEIIKGVEYTGGNLLDIYVVDNKAIIGSSFYEVDNFDDCLRCNDFSNSSLEYPCTCDIIEYYRITMKKEDLIRFMDLWNELYAKRTPEVYIGRSDTKLALWEKEGKSYEAPFSLIHYKK